MDTTSFNLAITNFFLETYNVEYLSDYTLTYEWDGDLYRFLCKFRLNQADKPVIFSGQFATLDEFTDFTITELKSRRFPTIDYFVLIHEQPSKTIV